MTVRLVFRSLGLRTLSIAGLRRVSKLLRGRIPAPLLFLNKVLLVELIPLAILGTQSTLFHFGFLRVSRWSRRLALAGGSLVLQDMK